MTQSRKRQLKLGIGLQGAGGHWRDPEVESNGAVSIAAYQEYARIAEAAKFDFGFIADSAYITKHSTIPFLSRLEPMTALSAISAVTKHLGLVGTFTTSYSEPYTTARQLASLDIISDGRAGWNAVTSALEGVARNHGHDKLHDHALRYRIAKEYIEVVKGLWNSWEDDAFTRNKETGEYVDLDKLHTLDHVGEFFKVQGPLNLERSKQGHPIIFQAGASEAGRDLAGRYADAVFTSFEDADLEKAKQTYRDIKSRTASYGRNPDEVLLFPMISPVVGATAEEAQERYEEGNQYIDVDYAVKYLSRYFSFFDFSQFDLDQPLPELGDIGQNSFRSMAEYYLRIAREENLTLRQLAYRATNPRGDFVGTAEAIADKFQHYFEERAVDGFIVAGSHRNLRNFTKLVVPILQERGLFRTEYESDTLRGNLGVSFPVNRYTEARNQTAIHG
ncbi:LLM class flavin-dependent oxidoreductase [Paenibacillus daejeonensis]|uniref:LLM class flavin-dependent oxidoreductase n=1 Tax=Paenibacillus daejeonensis TaxID=135193 RepID=UPI00035E4CAD|nr:LLM class flavin-dependent oxidoreductase [Paenibacillus daejeonensis]